MKQLFAPIYRSVMKRREIKIFLLCALYPIMVSFISFFQAGYASLAENESLSFMEFWSVTTSTQLQMAVPLLIFAYAVSSIFKDEIQSKLLFLYKDLKKSLVFKAKIFSLSKVLVLYCSATFFSSFISYYVFLIGQPYLSGQFFPASFQVLGISILTILSRLSIYLIVTVMVAFLSIKYNQAIAIISGLAFMLFSNIASALDFGRFLIPTGYVALNISFSLRLILLLGISFTYYGLLYYKGVRIFSNVEF